MGERPQPELLLACLPEAGEPVRLDREKEEYEPAEHDDLEVRREARPRVREERAGGDVEEDREEDDERRAEERSEHAAHPADDDHQEDLERAREVERLRLCGAAVEERP